MDPDETGHGAFTCIFCGQNDHRTARCVKIAQFLGRIGYKIPTNETSTACCVCCRKGSHCLHNGEASNLSNPTKKKNDTPKVQPSKKWKGIFTCIFCGTNNHRTTKCEGLAEFLAGINEEFPMKNPDNPTGCFYCADNGHYVHRCGSFLDLLRRNGHNPHQA